MTRARPHTLQLSTDELHIIQEALWHWEDAYRSSRVKAKTEARKHDENECGAKIAKIRNLKARTFRVETKASSHER